MVILVPLAGVSLGQSIKLSPIAKVKDATFVTHSGDDRIFITTLDGRIYTSTGKPNEPLKEFLDISRLTCNVAHPAPHGLEGIYSMAFHPQYPKVPYFFLFYVDASCKSVIARYQLSTEDPTVADPSTGVVLLQVSVEWVHHGGQVAFGPDGYLWASFGDGGPIPDIDCKAQRLDTLRGKLIRIDVNQNINKPPYYGIPPDNPFVRQDEGVWNHLRSFFGLFGETDNVENQAEEIFALGLRAPWRFSFDHQDGRLFIADVGESSWEEVDVISLEKTSRPINFGWRMQEGRQCNAFDPVALGCSSKAPRCTEYEEEDLAYLADIGPEAENTKRIKELMHSLKADTDDSVPVLTSPVYTYGHGMGGCSITGGYVYRGSKIPDLVGKYIFSDYCKGEIWVLDECAEGIWKRRTLFETGEPVISFGQDAYGELYAVFGYFTGEASAYSGENTLFRIEPGDGPKLQKLDRSKWCAMPVP